MLCCILDSRVNSYPTTVCGTAFFKTTVKNSKILELQKKNTGGDLLYYLSLILHVQTLN